MDTSFDLVALLRQQPTTKNHKIRPTQFVSVAGGVQKRLETNIKNRKSSRLSVFDRIRNITKCDSPKAPVLSDSQQKALHRKQQLEKWKEEKEKKKKEAAAQKKKPFVAGMSQRKTFGPPPPPPRPMPSSSGRVTRSQARLKLEPKPSSAQTTSFAPSNATFKPPLFLNTEVPTLALISKKKTSKPVTNITFEPVQPKNLQNETKTTRTTRARPVANKPVIDKKKPIEISKSKIPQKPPPLKHQLLLSSSSSSDVEQPSKQRSKPNLRKPQEKPVVVITILQATTSISSQDSQDASISQETASMSEGIESTSSQDEISTPRTSVPKSESSSEEKLRSPKALDIQLTPEQIATPCVTMSRGKDNARKEMMKKLEEGLLDEDNSDMESVNHFQRQLNSEIARMTAMCETWDEIFAQTVLPEPIQELVLTAVGQARLLMSQKLQQFAGLLECCARPTPGASLVTPADLHGFWDMVFMQVENVDMRFKHLEELRLRDWTEELKPVAKKIAKPVVKKAAVKPSGGPSRLREMIAAARKAKLDQESQSDNSGSEKSGPAASPETKTFEAGFFRISSPLKQGSPAPATPSNKSSLRKTVLTSEAKSVAKNSTSFAMLRASLMSKSVDIEGVSPLMQTPTIAPVNLQATPARSILKQSNPASNKKPDKLKTVLFHDEPSSPTHAGDMAEPGIEPLPADDKENVATPKPASTRKLRLSRQNAEEHASPVRTRRRARTSRGAGHEPGGIGSTPLLGVDNNVQRTRTTRRSVHTPAVEDNVKEKRSTRKSLQTPLVDENVDKKRSTRRSVQTLVQENVEEKRSRRKSVQTPVVQENVEEKRSTRKTRELQQDVETPKRSTRRKRTAVAV